MGMMGPNITGMFGNRTPTTEGLDATQPKHSEISKKFAELAYFLDDVLQDGRNKSICFTELENAAIRAHKTISETEPLEY